MGVKLHHVRQRRIHLRALGRRQTRPRRLRRIHGAIQTIERSQDAHRKRQPRREFAGSRMQSRIERQAKRLLHLLPAVGQHHGIFARHDRRPVDRVVEIIRPERLHAARFGRRRVTHIPHEQIHPRIDARKIVQVVRPDLHLVHVGELLRRRLLLFLVVQMQIKLRTVRPFASINASVAGVLPL